MGDIIKEETLKAADCPVDSIILRKPDEPSRRDGYIIIKEEIEQPMLTKEMILEWFGELKKYGVKRKDHKRRLIDLFLNSVHLFEDRLVINFNYKDGTEAVRLVEVENSILSSDSATVAAPELKDTRLSIL